MFAAVFAGAPDGFVVVFCELQGGLHLLIREKPVAMHVVQVIRTILEENANRLGRGFTNQRWINIAAAAAGDVRTKGDAGEAADVADDFAKLIRPLPGD